MSGIISPKGSQGHDISQPLQVAPFRRPDHPALRALVSALLPQLAERGLTVHHTTIYRWVQRYSPELEKRCKPLLKQTNDSWRVDETYIKVKGEWLYLYRAVDSASNTLEFLLSKHRDIQAAKRFSARVLNASPTIIPRVINVDQNPVYPKAVEELKAAGQLPQGCQLRPVKYLNNLIEQDHRFIKRLVKAGLGFFSFPTAWRTLRGYETMHMIRKGQVSAGEVQAQVKFVNSLFGLAT
jgi:transposase, IS6 family